MNRVLYYLVVVPRAMVPYPADEEGRVHLNPDEYREVSESLDRVFSGHCGLPDGICAWTGKRAWRYRDWSVKDCQRVWDSVPFDVRHKAFSR